MTDRIELNYQAINAMLISPNGPVVRDLLRRGLRVEAAAKRRVRVDQGRLRNSITHTTVRTVSRGQQVFGVRVGTNVVYAPWVHNGTGVYGPRGQRIVPVRASVLRFRGRDGNFVFRPSVAGQRPNPFLREALEEARH
jgi:hypothetical protein